MSFLLSSWECRAHRFSLPIVLAAHKDPPCAADIRQILEILG